MTEPLIQIVDKNDQPTGSATITKAQQEGLYHRIVRVMLESEDDSVLLQKRHSSMITYPDCWDNSAAGHVDSGESYLAAAKRELFEEIGATAELKEAYNYKTNITSNGRTLNRFNKIYRAVISKDTKFILQPDEVSEVKWVKLGQLGDFIKNNEGKVTDGLKDFYKLHSNNIGANKK